MDEETKRGQLLATVETSTERYSAGAITSEEAMVQIADALELYHEK